MELMDYIQRDLEKPIRHALSRGRSVLLLGARQTGKTTLINRLNADLSISFLRSDLRLRYEKNPEFLISEVESLRNPLVILDEVQRVPEILNIVQDLVDRRKAQFILTGSSARKLRRGTEINLLPGRVLVFKMHPLSLKEFPSNNLEERLLYGSLPGILAAKQIEDREAELESYVTTYLDQEVRAESIVRNLSYFARFLELAAAESGQIINLRKLSQEVGVAHTTIAAYYSILEDCLIAERIESIKESKVRKRLTRSDKYLFFDLGVRRVAAQEGIGPPRDVMGRFFEQFVGLELLRRISVSHTVPTRLRFWRDPDGPEVDWVLDQGGAYTPIEAKWTDTPTLADARHLETFLSEYKQAKVGYIVCRASRKAKLSDRIFALPWQETNQIIDNAP